MCSAGRSGASDPDVLLLGAAGRLGLCGELIFQRSPRSLLYATVVQLDNRVARGLWAAIESRHQQVVRDLLARAEAAVRDWVPARHGTAGRA